MKVTSGCPTGKGNLVKQAVSLAKLGVSGKKQLPSALTQSIEQDTAN